MSSTTSMAAFNRSKTSLMTADFFHSHDSQVIFFTAPDDETFVSGDIATSAMGPVTGNTGIQQERISRHVLKHNVSLDQFLVSFFRHLVFVAWGQRNVFTTEFGLGNQSFEDFGHGGFHSNSVVFGHSTRQGEFLQVSSSSDSHRQG